MDIPNHVQSLNLLQTVLHSAISSILYMRNIFSESDYTERILGCIPLKFLDTRTDLTKNFSLWLNGAFDALRKEYLKRLFLIFSDPKTNFKIEIYKFLFQFPNQNAKEKIRIALEHSANNYEFQVGFNKEEIQTFTIEFLQSLIQSLKTLPALPDKAQIYMQLEFTDDTPADYQPPSFQEAPMPLQTSFKLESGIGHLKTNHHFVGLQVLCNEILGRSPNALEGRSPVRDRIQKFNLDFIQKSVPVMNDSDDCSAESSEYEDEESESRAIPELASCTASESTQTHLFSERQSPFAFSEEGESEDGQPTGAQPSQNEGLNPTGQVSPLPKQIVSPLPKQTVSPLPKQIVSPLPKQIVSPLPESSINLIDSSTRILSNNSKKTPPSSEKLKDRKKKKIVSSDDRKRVDKPINPSNQTSKTTQLNDSKKIIDNSKKESNSKRADEPVGSKQNRPSGELTSKPVHKSNQHVSDYRKTSNASSTHETHQFSDEKRLPKKPREPPTEKEKKIYQSTKGKKFSKSQKKEARESNKTNSRGLDTNEDQYRTVRPQQQTAEVCYSRGASLADKYSPIKKAKIEREQSTRISRPLSPVQTRSKKVSSIYKSATESPEHTRASPPNSRRTQKAAKPRVESTSRQKRGVATERSVFEFNSSESQISKPAGQSKFIFDEDDSGLGDIHLFRKSTPVVYKYQKKRSAK